jgi:predicted dehydrogenase
MGVYPLHAITGILGPAQRVSAFASHVQEDFVIQDGDFAGQRVPVEVADNWMLLLDLGDARLATVSANNVAHASQSPQMELFGLDGTLAVDLLDVAAPVDVYRPADGWQNVKLPHDRNAGPDHLLGVAHLIDCIESGAKPLASVDHAIHVIDILEAAARSAASGQAERLTTTFDDYDKADARHTKRNR